MARLEDIELPEGDSASTIHLNPAAQFHPRVLLPGDPARAMAIATSQLSAPRMFNHRRGLWGYSGETEGGVGFTIQASGMGGPSAAIVVEELCDLGAEVIVRVGTCGAISPGAKLGDLIVASEAICDDGSSQALSGAEAIAADHELARRLTDAASASGRAAHTAKIATVDLFYDPDGDARYRRLASAGALAIEMEAAAVFAVAARRGVKAACLLGVTDELYSDAGRERMTHDEMTELGTNLGAVAIAALTN
ncbi:MAG: hypothetical protein QM648_11480 [Solirubrobacterales bacterium]